MTVLDIVGLALALAAPVVSYIVGHKRGSAAVRVTPLGPPAARIDADVDAAAHPPRVTPQ